MNNADSRTAAAQLQQTTQGLSKFDLVITSTLSTDLRIELFNHDFSQTDMYNSAVQQAPQANYYPLGATGTALNIKAGTGANNYFLAYTVGGYDAYTNANAVTPPADFNSRAYVFFNENGVLVYQPGYVNGALDAGTVTVDSKQTNYKHVFKVMGKAAMNVKYARVKVNAAYDDQLNQEFSYVQSNIVAASSAVPFSTDTYLNENQNQANIVTMPVNKEINPKTGFWYTVLASANNVPNVINMSLFFVPLSKNLLNLI